MGNSSLPALLRASAGRFGARVALTGPGLTLTYDELDRCVDRLAARFTAAGLRPRDRVGLAVARGPLPLILSAALMRAGCAYVPLDVHHPAARLRRIVEGARIGVALCDDSGARALAELPLPAVSVSLDDVRSAAAGGPVSELPAPPRGDFGAYVMFTSGSSGVPKGVEVTHANLMTLLDDALPLFGYGDDEAWPLVHGHGFDVSVWEIWAGIAVGARLIWLDDEEAADTDRLAEVLARHRPTRLHIVPSVFRYLAETIVEEALPIRPRSVIFCGEALNYRAIRTWSDGTRGPDPEWINVYGITETTVYNTFHRLTPAELATAPAATPIGRCYANSPGLVLGENLRPVPAGEAGEIVLGGRQVSPGYLHDPDLTAARFVTLPSRNGRWYRTGDLGVADEHGVLHYVGRLGDQVKIRGLRIELGEIDGALRQVPWVRDGTVVVKDSPRGEPVLVACVTTAAAERFGLAELRAAMAQLVPEYMLPNRVVYLDSLPQNANGKTDRRALAGAV
jgi:amino acid adenylation domain-containing protein